MPLPTKEHRTDALRSLVSITFTGIDQRTDFEALRDLALRRDTGDARWPFGVELGVLVGGATVDTAFEPGHFHGIFPPMDFVRRFGEFGQDATIPTALHLCGTWSQCALGVDTSRRVTRENLLELTGLFGRTQLNLHPDYMCPNDIDAKAEAVAAFATDCRSESVILQHRAGWDAVPIHHPKVEYLFDRSGGGGIADFESWPEPMLEVRQGYAGGIGPETALTAAEFAAAHRTAHLWFDMEGKVRTGGAFDVPKAYAVLEVFYNYIRAHS